MSDVVANDEYDDYHHSHESKLQADGQIYVCVYIYMYILCV